MEFKFPQDWFEPPFTEFVLVSKEELSDDEWKIVFDPLVKKGVSDIEATISSDTRFVLLQEMDYGYESTDDDDYLPDFLRAEYQPDQTLSDYSPEQLTESSAIEGYQPLKYSVVGNRAETFEAEGFTPYQYDSNDERLKMGRAIMDDFRKTFNIDYDKDNNGRIRFYLTDKWHYNPNHPHISDPEGGYFEKLGDEDERFTIYTDLEGVPLFRQEWMNTDTENRNIRYEQWKQRIQKEYPMFDGMRIRPYYGNDDLPKQIEVHLQFKPPSKKAETFNADSKEEARLKKYEKTYGKEGAKVRNRIFKRILAKAQDGTKAGQWSARKAQSLTEDYEKAMGKKGKKPYKSSKRTKSQKSLKDWGDKDWRTKSGKKSSKTGERYLPAKAIKALTDEEYKKTSAKKRKDMKKGKQFSDQPKSIAKKVKKYRAESSKPSSVEISRSSNPEKKLMAVFYDDEGKKMKTTHFGQRGASDYTKHGDKERMERYLERHGGGFETSTKEDWKDPTTAGSLSRWILWNKPSLKSSFDDYKRRFGLKGSINVSKSAEEETSFPFLQFTGAILLVSAIPLFLDNRRDKV